MTNEVKQPDQNLSTGTSAAWTPPLRKNGTPFHTIAELAAMPDHLRMMHMAIMGKNAPPADLLAEAVANCLRQDLAALGEKATKLHVYFVQTASGPIKIGYAADPRKRVQSMQSGSFEVLTLLCMTPGGAQQEARFHARFRKHWLRGEWFSPHADILGVINEIKAAEIDRLNTPAKD